MRIKKTSQTTPIQAQVVNTQSNSTTDSYSCDYVNGLNEYSTTETVCGTFLGKPLYRKVYTGSTSSATGDNILIDLDSTWDIHNAYGKIKDGGFQVFINSLTSTQHMTCIYINNNKIYEGFGTALKNKSYELVIEYTKTTD